MFERFTRLARQSLVEAANEARSMGHNYLGTEHQLLGLLRVDGIASGVLHNAGITHAAARAEVRSIIGLGIDEDAPASVGIDIDAIREAVDASFGSGALERALAGGGDDARSRPGGLGLGGPPFTPRAKKVMELSLREALALKHHYIGTEHVLLGILHEGQGVAAEIIRRLAPDADIRSAVVEALRDAS